MFRKPWRNLALLALSLHLGLATVNNCSTAYNRIPVNSDLAVDCGTNVITLEVNLCTALWAGFNHTSLAMNGQHDNNLCFGTTDTSVDPPIVRFQLPVNDSQGNPCRTSLQIVDEGPGTGTFSSFSNVQSVIITGFIDSPRSSEGLISYSTDLYYHFSCHYPLAYFINNTQIVASSVSVATKGNNGTFIDTLSMSVYNDSSYTTPLVVPEGGLALRSKVYVEVKATNLSGSFHILLDHCFATPSPYNVSISEQHDFFTGCNIDSRTIVELNGKDLRSRFYFEAFRFVEHQNQQKSSLYLHCIMRLCEPNKCQELLKVCGNNRRKREAVAPFGSETAESTTVSVGPIFTRDNGTTILAYKKHSRAINQDINQAPSAHTQQSEKRDNDTGLAVGLVLGLGATVVLVLGGWFVLKKVIWAGGGRAGSFC